MVALKTMICSLVLGDSMASLLRKFHFQDVDAYDDDHHHIEQNTTKSVKTPFLIFLPTRELVTDTYRLATIARDLGMDFYPTPSLSHLIFSYPSSSTSSSSPYPYSYSSISLPLLSMDAVHLSFPCLSDSSTTHLRSFVSLSKGLFKLVFTTTRELNLDRAVNHWNCSSSVLFSRITGSRIDSMDSFSQALAGNGWTFFKTKSLNSSSSADAKSVYLFRRTETGRARGMHMQQGNGGSRVRELRLPTLDFRNVPLRILQYILLMTDDLLYLG